MQLRARPSTSSSNHLVFHLHSIVVLVVVLCSPTLLLGSDATPTTHLDSSGYQLTFRQSDNSQTSTSYYCYQPPADQNEGGANTASLQLLPPLPQEGTILVAHLSDKTSFFNLRIANGYIVFGYRATDNIVRDFLIDAELERTATTYQIDLNVTQNRATIILHTVDDNGRLDGIGYFNTEAANATFYPRTGIFSTVCIGGSLVEYLNYVGTMRSGFFNHIPLFDERNACVLKREQVDRSDFINFVDNDIPRSLTLNRYSLRSHTIEFQARYPVGQSGQLLVAEDETKRFLFTISTIGAGALNIHLHGKEIQNFQNLYTFCDDIVIADGEWHAFTVILDTEPLEGQEMSITVTANGRECTLQNNGVTKNLPFVIDSPLQFGLTHSIDEGSIFSGFISNITLRETADSEIFRPNLEALPRMSSQFDTSSSNYCLGRRKKVCPLGEVCWVAESGFTLCSAPEKVAEQDCPNPLITFDGIGQPTSTVYKIGKDEETSETPPEKLAATGGSMPTAVHFRGLGLVTWVGVTIAATFLLN